MAHRGGGGLAPENTLAACHAALRLGVDAVEVDVRLTADGVPVLLHDATLDRTTNGHGPLAAQTAAAAARLDATCHFHRARLTPEPPPRLEDALALLRGRAAAHVELKGEPRVAPALVAAVVRVVRDLEMAQTTVLLSFDWLALQHADALAPELATGALATAWPKGSPAALPRLAAAGVAWLGLRHGAVTPARAALARAAELRLGVWTVNRTPSLRRVLRLGVEAITTDRPDRLLALLASPGWNA